MQIENVEIESLVATTESTSSSQEESRSKSSYRKVIDDSLSCWLRIAATGRVPLFLSLFVLLALILVLPSIRNFLAHTTDSPSSIIPVIHQPIIPNNISTTHINPVTNLRPPTLAPTTQTAQPTLGPGQTKAPISRSEKIQAQIELWGKWHFWDNLDPATRPALSSYVPLYPNGDVPYKSFPARAWQADAVYVNHFIDSAVDLIHRAKEVIFTEYGWGPRESLTREQILQRNKFFKVPKKDLVDVPPTNGGWTTERTFLSLSRRLLHCMMIRCQFTIVVGGGSAKAMGLGNHFSQSYLMQFQQLMNPVFDRLGVNLVCRNMASVSMNSSLDYDRNNTGQGMSHPITASSIHSALGFSSIYGDDIDIFVWDGDEQEALTDAPELDLLYRQALMTPKAPVLVGGSPNLLRLLYLHADADVMALGNASAILKPTTSVKQALSLPWSLRFMDCTNETQSLCDDPQIKYQTQCWIQRDDVAPAVPQDEHIHSPSKDMPGFRQHLLRSRVLAMTILDVLEDALASWSSTTMVGGHPLADRYWHIGSYYDNIRDKVKSLNDTSIGTCHHIQHNLPQGVCTVPMKAKTECTPRFDPEHSNIQSIIKPGVDAYIPKLTESMLYDGPDVPNKLLYLPVDEESLDVVQILSNRRILSKLSQGKINSGTLGVHPGRILDETYPWHVSGSLPGTCDGQMVSICGRLRDSSCLLSGHVDSRGGISGDESSGSLDLILDELDFRMIIFHFDYLRSSYDGIMKDEAVIDISVNGDVVTTSDLRSGFFIWNISSSTKLESNVTVGVQIRHCKNPSCRVTLTHIYWS